MLRLDIPTWAPDIELNEPVNREVLTWLVGNPKAVDKMDKSDPKVLYSNLISYAQRLNLDDTVTQMYSQKEYDAARLYTHGVSLQNLPKCVRHPLTHGFLFDIDLVNCHPVLMLFLAGCYDIPVGHWRDYVDNREARLTELISRNPGSDRSSMKAAVLKIMNGGGLQYEDPYLCTLKREIVALTQSLLEIYPEYTTMKKDGSERTPLALLLQTCENWVLQILLPLLEPYDVCVLSFDGCMTRKQVPPEAAERMCDVIEQTIVYKGRGLRVALVDKPVLPCEVKNIKRFERLPDDRLKRIYSSYEQVKQEFEQTNFRLRSPPGFATVCYTENNPALHLQSCGKLKEGYTNLWYYTVHYFPERPKLVDEDEKGQKLNPKKRKSTDEEAKVDGDKVIPAYVVCSKEWFVVDWLKDENMLSYDTIDFCPPPAILPPRTFNLWQGFSVQHDTCNEEDVREMQEHLIPFIRDIVCSGNLPSYKYLMYYLAQLMAEPGRKTGNACVMLGEEGAGKNTFTTLIGMIMGLAYMTQTSVLKDVVVGRFACPTENKLLLVCDEIHPSEMREHGRFLMDLITCPTANCEKKGVSCTYTISNFLRIFFSTNDGSRFMKLPPRDRKYFFVQTAPTMIGNKNYFDALHAIINKRGVRRALYEHLIDIDYTGFNFQTQRVETQMYTESKLQSVPKELSYLRDWALTSGTVHQALDSKTPTQVTTQAIFDGFTQWLTSNNAGVGKCQTYSTNPISFGIFLRSVKGFDKCKYHGAAASHYLQPREFTEGLHGQLLLSDTERDWLLQSHDITHTREPSWDAYLAAIIAKEEAALMKKQREERLAAHPELTAPTQIRYSVDSPIVVM